MFIKLERLIMITLDLIEKAIGFEYLQTDKTNEVVIDTQEKQLVAENLLRQPVANAITIL